MDRTFRIDDGDELDSSVRVIVIILHDFSNKF